MSDETKTLTPEKRFRPPNPIGDMPIELANVEIIEDELPTRGSYNHGSKWDHLILRMEEKFTKTTGMGPACILSEEDGMAFTSRARLLDYGIASRIVSGSRRKDKDEKEIPKTGKVKLWMKTLPTQLPPEMPKEVPVQNE